MALEIVRRVNENFRIRLPDAEISYVAVHMGAKSSAIDPGNPGQASALPRGQPGHEAFCRNIPHKGRVPGRSGGSVRSLGQRLPHGKQLF